MRKKKGRVCTKGDDHELLMFNLLLWLVYYETEYSVTAVMSLCWSCGCTVLRLGALLNITAAAIKTVCVSANLMSSLCSFLETQYACWFALVHRMAAHRPGIFLDGLESKLGCGVRKTVSME